MKKHILIQAAFLITNVYTTNNCSDWLRNKWENVKRSDWYRGLQNPKPTYYKGYSDWLIRNNPELYSPSDYENTPLAIRERDELNKEEYEGISPRAVGNLQDVREELIKDLQPMRSAYFDLIDRVYGMHGMPYEKREAYMQRPDIQKQEQQRRIAEGHLDELNRFIRHQKRYPQAIQEYKYRRPWLKPASFGGIGQESWGGKRQYPQIPYSPYGD